MTHKPVYHVKPVAGKGRPSVKKAASMATKAMTPSARGTIITNVGAREFVNVPAREKPLFKTQIRPLRTSKTIADKALGNQRADRPSCISRYVEAYRASPADQHSQVLQGIPSGVLSEMAAVLGMPFMDIVHGLRLASSTIRRRQAKGELLALDESERTLGLIRLIGQVQDMVERAGDPTGFDAGLWVRDWLLNPSPALGGEKPLAYLSSSAGQQVLSDLLMRNLTGAYS